MRIAMRRGAAARAKHMLRRYHVLQQRIRRGEIKVLHIPGDSNPADFLTKWVPADKLRKSISYASGGAMRFKTVVKSALAKRRGSGR